MLTASQQQALDTTRHRSVTANAGSGKTMVLVERYVNILLSRKAFVNEVVAITFTDKAASELRRKISESIAKRIPEASDVSERNALEEIRDQLSGAVIGTIHWFCAKILREYPVEAGIDAAFVVPELVDQRTMLDAAVKETFDAVLKEAPSSETRTKLFDLLRALGKSKVIAIVHALLTHREQVQRWVAGGLYSQTDAGILAHWRRALSGYARGEIDDPELVNDLSAICAVADGSGTVVFGFETRLKALKKAATPEERLTCYAAVMEYLMTKTSGISKKVISGHAQANVADQVRRVEQRQKSLSMIVDFVRGSDGDAHRILLAQTRVLLELYQSAIEKYEEKKAVSAYLDFDDLQIRMENLLHDERVRKKLSQRFKFIMVDEYQDTNRLQYEILLPLVHPLNNPADTGGRGNLFIVGDPKQSIYGFRDADVAVFNQTKTDIEKHSGTAGAVVLHESFRLLRDVAAFVNLVFGPLMKQGGHDYEVGYDRLILGRQNDSPGRIEIIVRESNDEKNPTGEPCPEFELIARRILQLRSRKYQVFDRDEKPHALRFSDVAVLLRSRNGLGELEESLIRHDIPYLISGGIGYFQTQGIYDFYNYFRFLLNTEDDVALAGILRSPFFNVSDAELFEVAYERKVSLWKAIGSARGKHRTFPSLVRALEIVSAHRELAARLSVPDLVNRIVDDTSYAGFVEGSARPEQIVANVEKLKRIAHRYEQQGFTNLYDFVRRLQRLIEQEEEEGQAAVDVFADAVKIMTVHAAKGLEFPVVILPALERPFQRDDEPFLDNYLGAGFTSSGESGIPVVEFLKRKSILKSRAEEKRVLYVACTRARDMLILSGAIPKNRSTHCFMNWVLDGLNVHGSVNGAKLEFDVTTECLRMSNGRFVNTKERHALNVSILREKDLPALSPEPIGTVVRPERHRLLIEPIAPGARGGMFSASKIRTYVECPAKYFLRYVVGLPATNIRLSHEPMDEEADVSIPAELRGRAFHYLMQHIDRLPLDEKTIVGELRKYILQDALSILAEPSIELDSIVRSVMNVVQSTFWSDVKNGSEARTEFTVLAPFGKNFLTGTIDRVYKDGNDLWHVLDYKTDALTETAFDARVAMYEPQLKFYALLVKKFFSVHEVYAHLLFTSLLEKPVHFHYDLLQLERFEDELLEIIAGIERGEFRRAGMPCSQCPFAPEGCSSKTRLAG